MNYNVNKYSYRCFLGLVIVLNYSSSFRGYMSLVFLSIEKSKTGRDGVYNKQSMLPALLLLILTTEKYLPVPSLT